MDWTRGKNLWKDCTIYGIHTDDPFPLQFRLLQEKILALGNKPFHEVINHTSSMQFICRPKRSHKIKTSLDLCDMLLRNSVAFSKFLLMFFYLRRLIYLLRLVRDFSVTKLKVEAKAKISFDAYLPILHWQILQKRTVQTLPKQQLVLSYHTNCEMYWLPIH